VNPARTARTAGEGLIGLTLDRACYDAVRSHVARLAGAKDLELGAMARAALYSEEHRSCALVLLGEHKALSALLEELDGLRGV
jgi:hypothetical protein